MQAGHRAALPFLALVLLVDCGGVPASPPPSRPVTAPWPADGWTRVEPATVGLDPQKLSRLVQAIEAGDPFPDLHSLLIVRNGHLAVEEYFADWSPDRLHTLQSVSKSFTSALVGIAAGRGEIRSIDERLLGFFPDMEGIDNLDDRKRAIRLEDLLTMRSGTDYVEGYTGSPHSILNGMSRGWDRFYLGRPMVRDPGTGFQYDSGAVIVTSAVLKSRTGLHADEYAARHLFPALGIDEVRWDRNAEGHPHTGGGLHLRPRDVARFGLLYLRGGRWRGRQVVPGEWVAESTRMHVRFERPRVDGHVRGYGYWWWILEPDPAGAREQAIYAAMGFRAQYLFVVPEHDLVVVVTGGARAGRDQDAPIRFLYSDILPAIRR